LKAVLWVKRGAFERYFLKSLILNRSLTAYRAGQHISQQNPKRIDIGACVCLRIPILFRRGESPCGDQHRVSPGVVAILPRHAEIYERNGMAARVDYNVGWLDVTVDYRRRLRMQELKHTAKLHDDMNCHVLA
jgi:hypothetical protein